jgi:hypothetical protein
MRVGGLPRYRSLRRWTVFFNIHMHDSTKATIMRIVLALCITFSICLMYYVNIVQKDYEVITSPNGPVDRPE